MKFKDLTSKVTMTRDYWPSEVSTTSKDELVRRALEIEPGLSSKQLLQVTEVTAQNLLPYLSTATKDGRLQKRKLDGLWRYYLPEYRLSTPPSKDVNLRTEILKLIARGDGPDADQMAKALNVSPQAIGGYVRRLTRKGKISRERRSHTYYYYPAVKGVTDHTKYMERVVLSYLEKKGNATMAEMAKDLGYTPQGIGYHARVLLRKDKITRKAGRGGFRWYTRAPTLVNTEPVTERVIESVIEPVSEPTTVPRETSGWVEERDSGFRGGWRQKVHTKTYKTHEEAEAALERRESNKGIEMDEMIKEYLFEMFQAEGSTQRASLTDFMKWNRR